MKKRTFQSLACLCAFCMLLPTMMSGLGGTAKAAVLATPVLSAKQTAPLKDAVAGSPVGTDALVKAGAAANSNVVAVGVKPLCLNAMGVKLDTATEVRSTWSSSGVPTDYQMEIVNNQAIAGYTGVLLYLKLPNTESAETEIWFQANDAVNGKDMPLKKDTPFYTLAKGDDIWRTIPKATVRGTTQTLTIQDGFDGYIYLPFDSFDTSGNANPFTTLTKLQFNLKRFGGPDGSAIVGPFFMTNNALRTGDKGWLEEEVDGDDNAVVRNLFTGAVTNPTPPSAPDPAVLAAKQASRLKMIEEGVLANLKSNTVFKKAGSLASAITITGVKPTGLDAMGAQLDTVDAVRQDWSVTVKTDYQMELFFDLAIEGYNGILLYVKLPSTGIENNRIKFQIYAGAENIWSQLNSSINVQTLKKGERAWTTITNTASNRVLMLSDGFDGYIYLPFDNFDKTFTTLTKLCINLQNFGGENGSAVIGPAYTTTNDLRTQDEAWLDGEADADNNAVVRNLFTGAAKATVLSAKQTAPLKDAVAGSPVGTDALVKAGAAANSNVVAVGVKPLGLNAMGVQLDTATEVRSTWSSSGVPTDYQMEIVNNQAIAGYTGVLLYLKLPNTESAETEIWFQANDAVNGKDMPLKKDTPFYTLAKGDDIWRTIPKATVRGTTQTLTIQDGFDGYIYLPFDSFDTSGNANPFTTLTKLQFNLKRFGGPDGSAIVGPFFMTSNALRTGDKGWLEEEVDGDDNAVVRNLFTGAVMNPTPPSAPDSAVLAAKQASRLKMIEEGVLADLKSNTVFKKAGSLASAITITGVKPTGLDAMGAQLDTVDAVRQDWSATVKTDYQMELFFDLAIEGYNGILLYVKLPNTGIQYNKIKFNIYDGVGAKWAQLNSSINVQTLKKGERAWTTITNTAAYRALTLSDGFDGYIYLPFNNFDNTFTTLTKLNINIQNFGGPDGSAVIGPAYTTINDLTQDIAWLDGEVDADNKAVVRNLFTGLSKQELTDLLERLENILLSKPVSDNPGDDKFDDFNKDGLVDICDLLTVKKNWCYTLPFQR